MTAAATVWRDYNTLGVPSSGVYDPEKSEIRAWGLGIETDVLRAFEYPEKYGAVGNGTTDDSTAMQAAITAAQTSGKPVLLTSAAGYALATGLSITSYVGIEGSSPLTRLIPAVGITAITVNTAGSVRLRNFGIDYPSAASSGTAAIKITAGSGAENVGSVVENLHIGSAYEGIFIEKGSYYTLANNVIQGFGLNGIRLKNTNVGDSNDSNVVGNIIGATTTTGRAGIKWESGGGVRIIGNKINVAENGIVLSLENGVVTTGMYIVGNSIEGISNAAIYASRQGATGALLAFIVNSNELIGNYGIQIPTDANGTWVYSLTATGNTFQGNPAVACTYADFDNVSGFNITGGTIIVGASGGSVKTFNARSGADRGIIGMIIGNSSTTAATVSSTNTTTISPS